MASLDVTVRVDRVQNALDGKGFEDVHATHYDNTPNDLIVLHDDHGQLANGGDDAVIRIIQDSDDVATLWSTLECSGMVRKQTAKRA